MAGVSTSDDFVSEINVTPFVDVMLVLLIIFMVTAPMMTDSQGLPLTEPKTPQMVFTMQLPHPVPSMSFVRHAVDLGGR